jgi:hypothetical protein
MNVLHLSIAQEEQSHYKLVLDIVQDQNADELSVGHQLVLGR